MGIIKFRDFKNISFLSRFEKEWKDLFIKDKANQERYDSWLDNKLNMLDIDPIAVSNSGHKNFEDVTNSKPKIYSIHERSRKNPRVLYYLLTDKNEVILLTAFIENNKSDYNIATRRAEQRAIKIIKGEV